jgi:hypothetical protein
MLQKHATEYKNFTLKPPQAAKFNVMLKQQEIFAQDYCNQNFYNS